MINSENSKEYIRDNVMGSYQLKVNVNQKVFFGIYKIIFFFKNFLVIKSFTNPILLIYIYI